MGAVPIHYTALALPLMLTLCEWALMVKIYATESYTIGSSTETTLMLRVNGPLHVQSSLYSRLQLIRYPVNEPSCFIRTNGLRRNCIDTNVKFNG